jgi:glycosyltransferase involved in cell wall biosynthesis
MRIAVDARELGDKPTGVGRYLRGLLREWTAPTATHGHELILYSHRSLVWPGDRCEVRTLEGSGGTWWEQRTLAAAISADSIHVLFSPAYSTPLLTGIPRVVALHDISFAAHPEWFAWREGLRRRVLARRSAAVAKTVVTISEFSKSEIVARLGTRPSHVRVIPPGIDAPARSTAAVDGSTGAHVLYVGSIFNRRHIPDLIAAFTKVASRRPDAELHIVGDNRSHPHEDVRGLIASSPVSTRMHWHDYVPDATLEHLYGQARAFVFLSEYEGLGLTPLEAMAAGIPPLLLDTAVARESCGSAALYVPLGDTDAIASGLERLLFDATTRRTLLAAAPSALARYSWPVAARETLRVLEEAG